jgi:hypothetical protein
MFRAALVCLILLAACSPPPWCDRTASARQRLEPSGACVDSSTGTSRALTLLGATCRDTSACSAADEQAFDDYVRCLNLHQPCASANERVTVDGAERCAATARTLLSPSCQAALD